MSLTAVTNLQTGPITRSRVSARLAQFSNGGGSSTSGPIALQYFADVSWTNSETATHWIEVRAGNRPAVLLPRFSSSARIMLYEWTGTAIHNAPSVESIPISVTVAIRNADQEVLTTISRTIHLSAIETTLEATVSGSLLYRDASEYAVLEDGNSYLELPTYVGRLRTNGAAGFISYLPQGVTPSIISSASPATPDTQITYGSPRVVNLQRVTNAGAYMSGLRDGGFYRATAAYFVPVKPTGTTLWYNLDDRLGNSYRAAHLIAGDLDVVNREVVFEYYRRGVPVPTITIPAPLAATVGEAFSYTVVASDFTSISANFGSLQGFSFNAATRRITGTFTEAGSYAVTITATNQWGTRTATLTIVAAIPQPVITSALSVTAVAGVPFSYLVTVFAATSVTVDVGSTGLTFNESTRVLSGTFSSGGVRSVSITASNAFTAVTRTLTINTSVIAPSFTSALTAAATVGFEFDYTVAATNATDFTITLGTASDAGLSYDATTRRISGVMTVAGTYNITMVAINPFATTTRTLVLTASTVQPTITSALTATAVAGQPFSYVATATNATSITVTGPNGQALPAGINYNAQNRTLSGAFLSGGLQSLVLTASNLGSNRIATLQVTVSVPQPVLTSPSQISNIAGEPFRYEIRANNATAFEVDAPGLEYDAINRTISGLFTEEQEGNVQIPITMINAFTQAVATLTVQVIAPRLLPVEELTLRNLHRVWGPLGVQETVYGPEDVPPDSFQIYGELAWVNAEPKQHTVEVTIDGQRTFLPSGARRATVLLGTWTAPDVAGRTVSIGVGLRSREYVSGVETIVEEVSAVAPAFFGTAEMSVEGTNIVIPAWEGVAESVGGVLGDMRFESDLFPVDALSSLTAANPGLVPISPMCVEAAEYRAVLEVRTGALAPGRTTYMTAWGSSSQRPTYVSRRHYNAPTPKGLPDVETLELFFAAPRPTGIIGANNISWRGVVNATQRIPLVATHRAEWTILSAPTGWLVENEPPVYGVNGPDRSFLVGSTGTPLNTAITLRATQLPTQTPTRQVNVTANVSIVTALPRTTITASTAVSGGGIALKTGEDVNVAFVSSPSPARWTASGLPMGVRLSKDGRLLGRPQRPGTYFTSITAQAEGFEVSLPTVIRFNIDLGETVEGDFAAALRVPWLLETWELVDLHVLARSREVQSTMFENKALRIKVGDTINCAIFFVGGDDAVFELAPEKLRLTIRKADNLEDLIVVDAAPPLAVTVEEQTYYELSFTTGAAEREVVLEWAEENEKNAPLACVSDVDWVKDGKSYSSKSFPVLLELDVSRP
jgi:hypothetical protein